jgi:hypothetical protein
MSRKELYDMVSRIKHLPIIPWNPRLGSEGPNKRVSNIRIKGAGLTLTRPLRDLS